MDKTRAVKQIALIANGIRKRSTKTDIAKATRKKNIRLAEKTKSRKVIKEYYRITRPVYSHV